MKIMHYMIVQFNDNNRQWHYGSQPGLTAVLRTLTEVKSITVNELTNELTD